MNFRRFNMFVYTFLLISFIYAYCDPRRRDRSPCVFERRCVTKRCNRNINGRYKSGRTPLTKAVWNGDIVKVRELIYSGANVNVTDSLGYSPLMISVIKRNEDIFLELLKIGADVTILGNSGDDVMSIAVNRGRSRFIRLLNIFNKADQNKVDDEGWPSIINMASNGYLPEVKVALYGGADINSTNPAGWSALMVAISKGHTEVSEYLIKEGADLSITSIRGDFTALSLAKRMGNRAIISLIKYSI